MNGTEKQIRFAEVIKKNMAWPATNGNAILEAAISAIQNIEHATFWIENKDTTAFYLLQQLQRGALKYKGCEFAATMGMTQTGEVFYK